MVKLYEGGVYILNSKEIIEEKDFDKVKAKRNLTVDKESAVRQTISYEILSAHNTSNDDKKLKLRFDSMASHDITYVAIIQLSLIRTFRCKKIRRYICASAHCGNTPVHKRGYGRLR